MKAQSLSISLPLVLIHTSWTGSDLAESEYRATLQTYTSPGQPISVVLHLPITHPWGCMHWASS